MSVKAILRNEAFPILLAYVISSGVDPFKFLKVFGMSEGELVSFVDWI